ncbi:S-formylglutathione hydrolase [Celerinatantimonas sp. YJH-8]|uniref:S-formylglutathione hydrolase n=1 Tax=Celerinatantimonas sp. YJH-8 TaxID=3228714 RepID=UPI0038C3ACEE
MNELIESRRCFSGVQNRYQHRSTVLDCDMNLSVYIPDIAQSKPLPVVYWLSGLTCTDRNFVEKAGAQRIAAELELIIVAPDTSPRGEHVPDDTSDSLGQGAGFYVNATEEPWENHYQMADYITQELPTWVAENLPASDRRAISGHSMGGHGALTLALKNPELYRSASAFSPIANPCDCPWGEGALSHYLGSDRERWKAWDSSELLAQTPSTLPMRVDIGTADPFFETQLKVKRLEKAAQVHQAPLTVYYHEGYDHSYFFIASFIEQQLRFHAQYL